MFFLAISPYGSLRLSGRMLKSMPRLRREEVALQLSIELPDALFKRPSLTASVVVPASSISVPVIDAQVIDNIRNAVLRDVGIDLTIAVVEPCSVPQNKGGE